MADAWRYAPFTATINQRQWRDVKKGRLVLGLVAAPILPILLGGLIIIALMNGFVSVIDVAKAFGVIEAAAASWSLVIGFAVLALRARHSGKVGRIDCFLLGVVLAASLPSAVWAGGLAFDAMMLHWNGD